MRYYTAGRYNVDAFFTGTVANYYDMYEGDTLDEVLDLLDAWVALDTKEVVPA